jgi:hypothetical protein
MKKNTKRTDNKPNGPVVTKRGNSSPSIIGKDWSRLKIGYYKVLLDQQAKKSIHHVSAYNAGKKATVVHIYSNTVSEKLMSLAYRTSGSLSPLLYNVNTITIRHYTLNDNGRARLQRKKREKGD